VWLENSSDATSPSSYKRFKSRVRKVRKSSLSQATYHTIYPEKDAAKLDKSYNSMMLWAASQTTFFSFCRSVLKMRTCTVRSCSDVAVDNAVSPRVVSLKSF